MVGGPKLLLFFTISFLVAFIGQILYIMNVIINIKMLLKDTSEDTKGMELLVGSS